MALNRTHVCIRLTIALIAMLLLAGIVDSPLFTFYRISGNSMRPNFENGDRVLVTGVPVFFDMVDVGDAVIARHDGEVLIKRVMGCPGDEIEIRAGVTYVNGERAEVPASAELRDYWSVEPFVLQDGEFYLLGDNRRVSVDSRTFGPVDQDEILGLVCVRFSGEERESAPVSAATER